MSITPQYDSLKDFIYITKGLDKEVWGFENRSHFISYIYTIEIGILDVNSKLC